MSDKIIRKTIEGVIRVEADALNEMARILPENIFIAVDILMQVTGRVVLSGMGKSGHIARKIAATLASTGTPAQYVHPGEASHGDLGMITSGDAIFLISNSGESHELADMIEYSRRHQIPMIAMTKKSDSTLAQHADYVIMLPDVPEACAIGLAPTTSTTCSLAMGDAIAVALMEQRGISREKFSGFHPGGALGANLRFVKSLMHASAHLPIVSGSDKMGDVLLTITSKGFGVAAVMADARVIGSITDGDLRRHMDGLIEKTAQDVANPNPITIPPNMLLAEALATMNEKRVSVLFVVDCDRRLVGLIHIHDLIRAGVV